MNQTEFSKQGVEEIRAQLQSAFEDPEGEFETMTKKPMVEFAKENWDDLAPTLEPQEVEEESSEGGEAEAVDEVPEDQVEEVDEEVKAEESVPAEEADTPLDLDPEPITDESPPTPEKSEPEEIEPWQGNPATNMHTGAPGRQAQRVGTRDLA